MHVNTNCNGIASFQLHGFALCHWNVAGKLSPPSPCVPIQHTRQQVGLTLLRHPDGFRRGNPPFCFSPFLLSFKSSSKQTVDMHPKMVSTCRRKKQIQKRAYFVQSWECGRKPLLLDDCHKKGGKPETLSSTQVGARCWSAMPGQCHVLRQHRG